MGTSLSTDSAASPAKGANSKSFCPGMVTTAVRKHATLTFATIVQSALTKIARRLNSRLRRCRCKIHSNDCDLLGGRKKGGRKIVATSQILTYPQSQTKHTSECYELSAVATREL